jgi:hypothetical protein
MGSYQSANYTYAYEAGTDQGRTIYRHEETVGKDMDMYVKAYEQ